MPAATQPHCMANNRASLMNVGREVDYAVRALSYMAVASRSGAPIRRAEIGQAQAIPRHYLAKILRKAVDGGLVESGVGPRGGFWLARDPASISLRDVYECINGPMCLVECLAEKPAGGQLICDFEEVCPQADVWRGAQVALLKYLEGHDLAGLSARADDNGLVSALTARA
ncbi:MAG TPA: Rrf2 family transcriptional regulator [Deltaproteobacteria bacterium]|nr:Rrf2 family transcriptional regulator [Candidatus Binatota bacterium]HIL12973.1 Rrf2 family transcriptional regulator [Deltaproteobacteria bacterium]